MDQWVDRSIRPPASNYPRVQNGTLVPLAQYRASFPSINGLLPPQVAGSLDVLDYGPNFKREGGLQEVLPLVHGASYQVCVPLAAVDGNDVEGVKRMEVRVPLGTNTGWNVRVAPRERYGSQAGLIKATDTAADLLVKQRFMLPQDAQL